MAKEEFSIEGLDELDAILRDFPDKLRRSALREAQRSGGDILFAEVKRRAPYNTEGATHPEYGHLRDNIKVAVRVDQKGASAKVQTGDAFWGLFLEFGTGPERKGRRPFIRPAVDAKQREAADAVIDKLRRSIVGP